MRIVLFAVALGMLAGCTQTFEPYDAANEPLFKPGPYHVGSGSGRGGGNRGGGRGR